MCGRVGGRGCGRGGSGLALCFGITAASPRAEGLTSLVRLSVAWPGQCCRGFRRGGLVWAAAGRGEALGVRAFRRPGLSAAPRWAHSLKLCVKMLRRRLSRAVVKCLGEGTRGAGPSFRVWVMALEASHSVSAQEPPRIT
ncbi:hypothetical protein E2C01_071257 [Portunus trituberculatus]|uniref:Uncharacterized protein n=1 Tax=Portunus trituberculatus TaxID=210409 RepID=A0A5B7I3X3_PORTR|nr:hypothetical protein [Portunus trituberculatus]